MVWYVVAIVAIAFVFDFSNGFHDSANSIATIVGTRVLSPLAAVMWAAFFNFAALFTGGVAVAKAVGGGMIEQSIVDPNVILGALLGAIIWNLITWYYGIPSSSSHALIGGYAGAAVAKAGWSAITWGTKWIQTLSFIVISPLVGFVAGFVLMIACYWIFQRMSAARVDRVFRPAQLMSSALLSYSHGGNDAQKTMGIIVGLLVASEGVFANADGISAPSLRRRLHDDSALGRDRRLLARSRSARCSAAGASCTRWARASRSCGRSAASAPRPAAPSRSCSRRTSGIPVSTTHTITGSIVGVGATKRCPRCGGASPDASCGRGCSRFRRRRSWRRCRMPSSAKAKGGAVLHIPTALGAVAIIYNLAEVTQPLKLTGDVLAAIYQGQISKWGDARIASLNPGVKLPATDILVVHRSDGSGTSYVFTDYLASVSPAWATKPGKGKEVQWPVGLGAKGNEGVAGQVKQTPGAIGYVELAYAKQNKLVRRDAQERRRRICRTGHRVGHRRRGRCVGQLPATTDYRISIVNAPGAGVYPISSFTWILVYEKQAEPEEGKKLVDFLRWALSDGQAMEAPLDYAPLPEAMRTGLVKRCRTSSKSFPIAEHDARHDAIELAVTSTAS